MMKFLRPFITVVLILFGLLTLLLSSSIIFDWFDLLEKEGNYVLFVVVANFVASILYLAAAWSLWKRKKNAVKTLFLALAVLILAFAGLLLHINAGGLYETKTISAMLLRIALTGIIALGVKAASSRENLQSD